MNIFYIHFVKKFTYSIEIFFQGHYNNLTNQAKF